MKIRLKTSILAGVCALLTLGGGSLKSVSKPYLGEYECKNATFGEREYLDEFEFIRLELFSDERFVLSYREKNERETHKAEGRYEYDESNGTLLLKTNGTSSIKRKFSLKNGVLLVTATLGDRLLLLRFEQK